MNKKLAVVALSGGMDSCVTAAYAKQEYDLALLHVNYGQRTQKRELKAFHDIAEFYNVKNKLVIDFSHFTQIGGSSLTDNKMDVTIADLNNHEVPTTYVPFRNANILSAATAWAEVLNANAIFIGAVYEDASGYPDCRPDFYKAFEEVIRIGTKPKTDIKVITPIINFSKEEIVKKGIELNAPLHLTWSCYQNDEEACGVCDSCAFRLRGFQKAGFDDPIPYNTKPNYNLL
ncbi:7-cyano-7-deazaguanine synthase [bacterium BRH_c32]|nr:MAG: 7-cyano-7-deazaguanine synthase [bacterium BRH_c32]